MFLLSTGYFKMFSKHSNSRKMSVKSVVLITYVIDGMKYAFRLVINTESAINEIKQYCSRYYT